MICSGFGHSDCPNIAKELDEAIKHAIAMGCDEFYCGLKGDFDRQFASAVLRQKENTPSIKVYFISPYVLIKNDDYGSFDGIIVPELESVPYKFKILKRNEWMVRESNFIIFYISHQFGGAYQSYEYALRKKKNFINLAE